MRSSVGERAGTLIVGGGPAAIAEALRLQRQGVPYTIVTDHFGGCMAMLGEELLQSYCAELAIAGSPCDLSRYLGSDHCRPTGRRYVSYVRDTSLAVHERWLPGRVTSLERDGAAFVCRVVTNDGVADLRARHVILATGIRSRDFQPWMAAENTVSCFAAYEDVRFARMHRYRDRDVAVVGSGNTAFQLAGLIAPVARSVTILAQRYLGVFPQETSNRFALRAPSQLTIERIAKSMEPPHGVYRPLRFLIYRSARRIAHPRPGLQFAFAAAENAVHIARSSFEYSLAFRRFAADENRAGFAENVYDDESVVVSATGVRASLPDHPWGQALESDGGFVRHDGGRTAVPGLFVAGSCAGFRSVNTMQPPAYAESFAG